MLYYLEGVDNNNRVWRFTELISGWYEAYEQVQDHFGSRHYVYRISVSPEDMRKWCAVTGSSYIIGKEE